MPKPPLCKKSRTLESENRQFSEEWKLDFYMSNNDSTMMCLRCKQQIKTLKRSNAKQHYESCKSYMKYMTLEGEAVVAIVWA